jgi:lycopene cyclase domain-containing protein
MWYVSGANLGGLITPLALCLIVVGFTFPWDNWAVRRGIWDFPDDRLLFRIKALPVEEVFFFIVQTLQVGWLTASWLAWNPGPDGGGLSTDTPHLAVMGSVVGAWLLVGRATRSWRRSRPQVSYAWHLLYWFAPILILQWVFAHGILAPRLSAIVVPTVIVGTILTIADVWAVRRGIWFFGEHLITGRRIAGILPWEEVAFFYITSILVAQSTILFLPADAR